MHDGIVRRLKCWYVPDLRKNLISLTTLAKGGLEYSGKDDKVVVTKDSLVVMKGKVQGGIPILEGSAVKGAMAISRSFVSNNEQVEVRHRRSRRSRKKGKQVLKKQGVLNGKVTGKVEFQASMNILKSDVRVSGLNKDLGGCRYSGKFIGGYSRYFLKKTTNGGLIKCLDRKVEKTGYATNMEESLPSEVFRRGRCPVELKRK